MIEDIQDIEITDVMIKKGYTTMVSELFNQNDDDKTKTQIQSICLSEAIKSSIQASTQIQELIANNKHLKSEILKLLTEISMLKDDIEWQPIETAPRDGTEIELLFPINWFNKLGRIGDGNIIGNYWYDNACNIWRNRLDYHLEENRPTHWRPLSQPLKEV